MSAQLLLCFVTAIKVCVGALITNIDKVKIKQVCETLISNDQSNMMVFNPFVPNAAFLCPLKSDVF